jgi:hypothetical protein
MAARDEALAILREFGLESLIGNIDTAIQNDVSEFEGPYAREAVWRSVRGTEQYKKRFKGIELRKANNRTPINEDQYLEIEKEYEATLRANGMPKGFYDSQEDFAMFIGNDVRQDELNTRIAQGYRAVMETEPGTKEELKRLYGLNDSDIAAFLIDPTRFQQTEAVRKAEAARRANAAREAGLQIQAQQAEELYDRGITQQTAQRGFQELGATQELFGAQQRGEEQIGIEEQIAGTFGTSAAAAQRIATRRRRRQAEFEGGGGLAETQQGITGLRTVGE